MSHILQEEIDISLLIYIRGLKLGPFFTGKIAKKYGLKIFLKKIKKPIDTYSYIVIRYMSTRPRGKDILLK